MNGARTGPSRSRFDSSLVAERRVVVVLGGKLGGDARNDSHPARWHEDEAAVARGEDAMPTLNDHG